MDTCVRSGRPGLVAAALILLAGCSSNDETTDSGRDSRAWPTRGWKVEAPEKHGMDSAVLDGTRAYAEPAERNTLGVVVVRHGVIVAEWYFNGQNDQSQADSWSMSKSVTSALIGIAMDDSLIKSVEQPMAEFLTAWQGTDKQPILLRHVLSMTSGLDWKEGYENDPTGSDVINILGNRDAVSYVLNRPVAVPPGTRWQYSSGDTQLLSGVLTQVTGKSAFDFALERVFGPLGMDPATWWNEDAQGHTRTFCCIHATPRDYAKFGLLFLRGGEWEGRQIVSKSWVEESTKPSQELFKGYGFQWWTNVEGDPFQDAPRDTYLANGHWIQRIIVIPSLDLVVVRSGLVGRTPATWDDNAFLKPVIDSIAE
jgi:CubicO group peptidase (beta-lactamase class C family)